MRVYADSSFILRLITGETGAEEAAAEYRRLGRPAMFYLPLHGLEVENGIRQRAFHERRILPSAQRTRIHRERDAALDRLSGFIKRGALKEVSLEMDLAFDQARQLSSAHTERLGARAIDLLHVGCALVMESEIFLTFDLRQRELAKLAGLQTVGLSVEPGN